MRSEMIITSVNWIILFKSDVQRKFHSKHRIKGIIHQLLRCVLSTFCFSVFQWMSNCKNKAFPHIDGAPADRGERREEKEKRIANIMTAEWLSGLMHWNNLPGSPESLESVATRQDKRREREAIKSWEERVPGESIKKTKQGEGGECKQIASEMDNWF